MDHNNADKGVVMAIKCIIKRGLFIAVCCITIVLPIASMGSDSPCTNQGMAIGIDIGMRQFISSDIKDALDPGPGAGIFMLWGATNSIALKMGMRGSIHTGKGLLNSQTVAASVTMMGMNAGFDFDVMPRSVFKPVLGIDIGAVRLNSSHTMAYNRWQSSETHLLTWDAGAGAGFVYCAKPDVSIGARISYRYMPLPVSANGSGAILDGSSIFANLTLVFHIKSSGMMGAMMPMGCMGMGQHNAPAGDTIKKASAAPSGDTTGKATDAGYYTCPMHPQIHEAKPGNCPLCGMNLVYRKE
jgi:hypothetical protein